MDTAHFNAVVLASELNLNELSALFHLEKKLRWEDTLIIKEFPLEQYNEKMFQGNVYLFSFGSAVFVNYSQEEISRFIDFLKKSRLKNSPNCSLPFTENFSLYVDAGKAPLTTYEEVVIPKYEAYYLEIIATVLAKSVALEKIESELSKLYDDFDVVIDTLSQGHLRMPNSKLAKLSGKILRYKFTTISYIMLLDKPDITWKHEEAANFFDTFSRLFELEDRYQAIRHKAETLMDITEVITTLTHASRGNRLEWLIIILIALEIVLSLIR